VAYKIPLTKGKFALIDKDDFDFISRFKWHIHSKGYAVKAGINHSKCFMHKLIMNTPDGMVCDHINRDRLDNRKSNLRNCTKSEDLKNRTPKHGMAGITYRKDRKVWQSQICIDGKTKYLGTFRDKLSAYKNYMDQFNKLMKGNI